MCVHAKGQTNSRTILLRVQITPTTLQNTIRPKEETKYHNTKTRRRRFLPAELLCTPRQLSLTGDTGAMPLQRVVAAAPLVKSGHLNGHANEPVREMNATVAILGTMV